MKYVQRVENDTAASILRLRVAREQGRKTLLGKLGE